MKSALRERRREKARHSPAKASVTAPLPASGNPPAPGRAAGGSAWKTRITGYADVAPGELLAHKDNFRRHPAVQQAAMKATLEDIGWVQNVVVSKRTGRILDGHLRVELAVRHGAPKVPVTYVDVTPAEERLVLATMDPLGAMAQTDRDTLTKLMASLPNTSRDLQPLLDHLAKMAKGLSEEPTPGKTDPNEMPALDEHQRRVKRGQVWQLGDHRLIVADCRDAVAVRALMNGDQANLLWSDPPYNVAYSDDAGRKIENDDMAAKEFAQFLKDAFTTAAAVCRAGAACYIAHSDSERVTFQRALEASGWLVKQCLIWVKNSAVLSRQDDNWQHEPILYGWKDGAGHYFAFQFTETTVPNPIEVGELQRDELETLCKLLLGQTTVQPNDRPSRSEWHPTMKPVELIERHMRNSSRRGEIVLDPFSGSGSTIIAAERMGRCARGVELDPVYADATIKRWERHTGRKAEAL